MPDTQKTHKNNLATFDQVAVSANLKETALNTEQTLDTLMNVDSGTIISPKPRLEDDKDELKDYEEATKLYNMGYTLEYALNFPKMQAQHLAFILSYFYGSSTPSAYGTGYKHVIAPMVGREQPTFTSGMRFGKNIAKILCASNAVDKFDLVCEKDSWAKLNAGIKATGKFSKNIVKETIADVAFNATSLTLAANAVEGANANERLAAIHEVYAVDPVSGAHIYVNCSAASGATPAVLTIAAPGEAATLTTYYVLYVAAEAAWGTFPALVTESPLRTTDLSIILGGKWTGSAFVGGKTLNRDVKTITISGENKLLVEYRPGAASGDYANYLERDVRNQKIKFSEEVTSYLLQQKMQDVEYFGVQVQLLGAAFDTGKYYGGRLIFPRCAVVEAPIKKDGHILFQEGDIQVLEDATYGSAVVECYNEQTGYAQTA